MCLIVTVVYRQHLSSCRGVEQICRRTRCNGRHSTRVHVTGQDAQPEARRGLSAMFQQVSEVVSYSYTRFDTLSRQSTLYPDNSHGASSSISSLRAGKMSPITKTHYVSHSHMWNATEQVALQENITLNDENQMLFYCVYVCMHPQA